MEMVKKCSKFADCWKLVDYAGPRHRRHKELRWSKNVTKSLIVRNLSIMLILDIEGIKNGDGQKKGTNSLNVRNLLIMLVLDIEGIKNGNGQKMLQIP